MIEAFVLVGFGLVCLAALFGLLILEGSNEANW
jgi:hypothetical protein